jgi:SAM-dependent methyltransferase
MIQLITEHPIASDSKDYEKPWGTVNDNTKSDPWWDEVGAMFGRKINYMDWGCAGGGLVAQALDRGHTGVALEGGDYWVNHINDEHPSAKQWKKYLGSNFFTCDITRPFQVLQDGESMKFDLISSWEVFEHLYEDRLETVFDNLKKHLADGGMFVGTVSTRGEGSSGIELHVTIHDENWWRDRFLVHFDVEPYPFKEPVRTDSGNFHVCLRKPKHGV